MGKEMKNNVLIGLNAGADIMEGSNIVIIGDNVRSLDKSQDNILFLGENVAIGEILFGEKINLLEVLRKYIIDNE